MAYYCNAPKTYQKIPKRTKTHPPFAMLIKQPYASNRIISHHRQLRVPQLVRSPPLLPTDNDIESIRETYAAFVLGNYLSDHRNFSGSTLWEQML
jgi:hypothetical protein